MPIFRPLSLLPVALGLLGCGFFTLDEPEEAARMNTTGGTGGATGGSGGTGGATGGTGGATGGAGGTGGATGGGAGTLITAGTGGGAGVSSAGGSAGAVAGGAGDTSVGGTAGTGGDAAGGAGAGGASAGSAGEGAGAGGTAGGGGAGGGSGGSGPASCAAINAQAQAYGGHCYYRNSTAVTWSAARSACEALSMGGHLVTITSEAEQTFVWGVATMMDAWIGATDGLMDNQGGTGMPSTWITGEDIGVYNGWASGEPNNYQKVCPSGSGDCWEHCGFMWVDTQGKWNDDICGSTKAYICEWDSGG